MRTYLIILSTVILLTVSLHLPAKDIDVTTAQLAGKNFLASKNIETVSLQLAVKKVVNNETLYYIFNNGSYGFVVVSADDQVIPVLAYSNEINWVAFSDTLHGNNVRGWMENYEKQILDVKTNDIPASEDIVSQWQALLSGQVLRGTTTVVPPLLTTTWDQGWPYNVLCPPGAVTGCVPTAMAQIMKYHNWPDQGLGSFSYDWGPSGPCPGNTFHANFGETFYHIPTMPNICTTVDSNVARLMYHCGVACGALFGPSTAVGYSSDSDPMSRAFVNFFRMAYSSIKYFHSIEFTESEWHDLIQFELIQNRPVYYRGDSIGSHAFVCDGVDASNMYHFNWGWGGMYNGYFVLTDLSPGGFNFNNNQHIIIGIKPNDGSTLVENTTWSGTIINTTHIAVPDAISLTISPGAIIKFGQYCKLQIWGKLTSIGTNENYSKLTAIDTADGWYGIKWENTWMNRLIMDDNDTSKLIYTQVEYSDEHGIFCHYYGKMIVDHCKINNNDAGIWYNYGGQHNGSGGGISLSSTAFNITDTEIFDNHATIAGGGFFMSVFDSSSAIFSQNNIHNNLADVGGGFELYNTINIIFIDNLVNSNQAILGAGGILYFEGPTLINNTFCNNSTIGGYNGRGGGLYILSCSPKIINNLFANNTKSGLYITENSNPMLLNNTISNNSGPDFGGGGIRILYNSNPILKNTILYGNTGPYGSQITLETTDCDPFFDHCDIQGGVAGFAGEGAGSNYNVANYTNNIDLPPLFVDPTEGAGTEFDGLDADWMLQLASPCVNAGDTTGISVYLQEEDLGGNPRINGVIDMGAFEFCAPDQPGAIAGNINPCQASSQNYTIPEIDEIDYIWTVPSGWTITSGQESHSIQVTVGSIGGTISVIPSNECGEGLPASQAVTVNALPAQPGAITGVSNPCQGASENYSVAIVAGQTYNWVVPAGWTIGSGQGSNSISVTVGSVSGNVTVTPSNTCGNGPSQSMAVVVNVVPAQPGLISGNIEPCQTSTQNYSVNNVTNVNYAWSVPSDWTINSGQGSNMVTITVGSTDGNIVVVPSNTCGNGSSSSLAVTVNSVLTDAGADQSIEYGNSTNLAGNATNGSGDYSWSWTPADLLVDATVQNPTTLNLSSSTVFTLTVSDAQTGCSDVDQMTVTVTGGPLGVIASTTPESVCAGESSQLYALVSGGSGNYTFSWTSDPAGYTSDIQNPVVYPSITTSYFVSVNDGSSTVTDDAQVFVSSFPAIPSMPAGPDTVDLKYILESQYTISEVSGADSYSWELTPEIAGTITGSGLTANVVWDFNFLGVASIKANAVNACGESEWSVEKQTFVENTVGIISKPECDLVVYPNPVSGDKISISFCYVMEHIEIVDMKGITLISKQPESENYSLTHQLPLGVYFVKVVYKNGLIVKKIVVE